LKKSSLLSSPNRPFSASANHAGSTHLTHSSKPSERYRDTAWLLLRCTCEIQDFTCVTTRLLPSPKRGERGDENARAYYAPASTEPGAEAGKSQWPSARSFSVTLFRRLSHGRTGGRPCWRSKQSRSLDRLASPLPCGL